MKLTDDFLVAVVREAAYYSSIGLPPAPAMAVARGVSPRLIHSWIGKAYQRGIADSPGPGKRADWHRVKCEACDGQGYVSRDALA